MSLDMALDGMIFDLDGTLIDSNGLHIEAFRIAFAALGYKVPADRIFVEVGKGGDQLVPAIIGASAEEADGDAIRKGHTENYLRLAKERGLKVFPHACELLSALRECGVRTALATSSSKRELSGSAQASGLRFDELFDEVIQADDAENTKPHPDVVVVACGKLKLSTAQCAMVGDTPYDAESCKRAGVVCLGVRSGGHDDTTLLASGARLVYADVSQIHQRLDEALSRSSPGSLHLTSDLLEHLMREALAVAREALNAGEVPIGALLARGDGTLLSRGFNSLNRSKNPTAHAEIIAFANAAETFAPGTRDLVLVSTLEPCVMCLGASMEAAVETVVYGLSAPADGGIERIRPPQSPESQMPRIVGPILPNESGRLFEAWLERPGNDPLQISYVSQLLRRTKQT